MRDELTGLVGPALLVDRVETSLARRARSSGLVAIFAIGLDRFSQINQTWGEDVGDNLLVAVGDRLRGGFRSTDTVSRPEGDVFVIVCEVNANEETADLLLARVRALFAEPYYVNGRRIELSASIGVIWCAQQDARAETLLELAERARLRARRLGGGQLESQRLL